jgi:hypothetical protein
MASPTTSSGTSSRRRKRMQLLPMSKRFRAPSHPFGSHDCSSSFFEPGLEVLEDRRPQGLDHLTAVGRQLGEAGVGRAAGPVGSEPSDAGQCDRRRLGQAAQRAEGHLRRLEALGVGLARRAS